jgi:orotidine-5'-phosphate decarboxylase
MSEATEGKALAGLFATTDMPTSDPTFFDRLRERVRATGGVLAVGLNPDPDRLPDDCLDYDYPRRAFNRRIVDATHEDVAAYVVNPAFYEDPAGWTALAETVAYARGRGVPVVVDGKWSDAPAGRARAELLDRADAATVTPFCGRDALEVVLDRDWGAFVVCRTPNRGAADLQDREIAGGTEDPTSVAEHVATLVGEWAADTDTDANADVGLLVGGPGDHLEALREAAPDLPFLAVGGATNDPEVAEFAVAEEGPNDGLGLVEVSREVLYAGETAGGRGGPNGMDGYAAAARQSARRLKRQLNRHR